MYLYIWRIQIGIALNSFGLCLLAAEDAAKQIQNHHQCENAPDIRNGRCSETHIHFVFILVRAASFGFIASQISQAIAIDMRRKHCVIG